MNVSSAERSRKIQELFDALVEVDPAEWAARLEQACPDDPDLRREVASLLAAFDARAPAVREALEKVPQLPLFFSDGPTAASAVDPFLGQTVAQYRVLEKLGSGGMGVVYKAHDTTLDRDVALKFLPPHLSANAEARTRFVHEARAASALDHANICTIHEIGQTEAGQTFIAMACYEGQTLKYKIKAGALPVHEALSYAVQMARGLAKAHARGIIHRDVKPANVMVTEPGPAETGHGVVKILDFGLAKMADVELTKTGMTLGTVAYMSPEQAKGGVVDHRTDVWSLGVVLYEMLTGERPFKGEYDQVMIYAILNEEPPALAVLNDALPPDLNRIVMRCLEKAPDLRYRDVSSLLADLESFQASSGSRSLKDVFRTEKPQPSIAVLPFIDMSPHKDQEYFSDGIAEELSDALAKVEGWRVVSRTSAFAFKGKEQDIRQIGKQLNVRYVLEGSVRKAGNQLRIRAELISVDDGFQLWSEKYKRELEDVFAIQEDIATQIVTKLKRQLAGTQDTSLIKRRTDNLEAYNLYLKARFHLNKRTEEDLKKCRAYCQRAIDEDATYAPAYAALADCFILLGFHGALLPNEAMPPAKVAAAKALELDGALAEAHTSMGCIKALYDWDWSSAQRAFEQALTFNPNYATAHHWYAIWYLLPTGQFEAGLAMLQRAQQLDPISPIVNAAVGWCYYFARRYDEAIDELRKVLDMDERFVVARDLLGQAYAQQGRYEDAIGELQKAVTFSGSRTLSLATLGHSYAMAQRHDAAQQVLEALKQRAYQQYVSAYDVALVYAGLGVQDQAFEWLEKAYQEHSGWLCFLNVEPRFDSLRGDPRFTALLERVNLAR